MPAAAERRNAVGRQTPGIGFVEQCVIGADRFHFCTQTVTIEQGGFRRTFAQAVEVVVMQAGQGMNARFCRDACRYLWHTFR